MTEETVGRTRPGAMAFVMLTVALSWSIWIGLGSRRAAPPH